MPSNLKNFIYFKLKFYIKFSVSIIFTIISIATMLIEFLYPTVQNREWQPWK